MSKNSVESIKRFGRPLGEPNRLLPARADFARLRRQITRDRVLVAIHGNEREGYSASPQPEFGDYRVVRKDFPSEDIRYYSIPKGLHIL